MIKGQDIGVRMAGSDVLRDIHLELDAGTIAALVGPNGSGKSTLLRAIAGLVPLSAGSLVCAGMTALMSQDNGAAPPLTVRQVVMLGRVERLSFRLTEADREVANSWIARVGITTLADKRMDQLSGGQRQLTYIAQTLARGPRVLLLDEPTSALDVGNQLAILELVRAVSHEAGLTTLVAIHDLALAARVADTVLVLKDGCLAAKGAPKDALTQTVLANVYGVDAEMLFDPNGHPAIRLRRGLTLPTSSSGTHPS